MIDWLYQTTLSVSLLIGLVLLIRKTVSHYLGANIAYWLWLIPLLRMLSWHTVEVPVAILEKVNLVGDKLLIRVIDNPNIYSITSLFTLELLWIIGLSVWLTLRIVGWFKFQKNLKNSSTEIDITAYLFEAEKIIGNRKVQFYLTDIPQAPFITGLLLARIYLPTDFFEKYIKEQQFCIVKHEITHLQRKDLWVQIFVELFRAVFWFNPIIHIAWSAFRHDQELACDYQVLAKSTEKERLFYGKALLTGLHAHALPSTMAFFTQHKQRFIMLEKHNHSQTKNILGIVLCTLLTVFALTKAPTTIAKVNTTDNKISFNFDDNTLETILKLVANGMAREVSGYENVPNISVSVNAIQVSAQYFEILLLKCSGLKLMPNGDAYKLVKDEGFDGAIENINQCLQDIKS